MLRTGAKDLKEQIKKEEYQQKFKIKSARLNSYDQIYEIFKNDHLPFANLVVSIASKLPNAPRKPEFRLRLENE